MHSEASKDQQGTERSLGGLDCPGDSPKGGKLRYAIVQQVRELSDGEVEWTDGMLYPILHRMESEGWVVSRWGLSETGRKCKYYRLEPAALPVIQNERKQWETVHLILNSLWTPQPT